MDTSEFNCNCAETCVAKYAFTREEQDDFTRESYRRAQEAVKSGKFKNEIAIVEIDGAIGKRAEDLADLAAELIGLIAQRDPRRKCRARRARQRHHAFLATLAAHQNHLGLAPRGGHRQADLRRQLSHDLAVGLTALGGCGDADLQGAHLEDRQGRDRGQGGLKAW